MIVGSAWALSVAAPEPASVTFPSSNVSPPMDCVPLIVTVKLLMASPPAEKVAVLPAVQAAGAPLPVELLFQKLLTPQVPAGAVPAPNPGPLPSQYCVAAIEAAPQYPCATTGSAASKS